MIIMVKLSVDNAWISCVDIVFDLHPDEEFFLYRRIVVLLIFNGKNVIVLQIKILRHLLGRDNNFRLTINAPLRFSLSPFGNSSISHFNFPTSNIGDENLVPLVAVRT